MGYVIEYAVVEFEPGWFEARVKYQGPFRNTFWKSIDCHGNDVSLGYGSTEFSVAKCERLIAKHKKRKKEPWVPKAVYRETL